MTAFQAFRPRDVVATGRLGLGFTATAGVVQMIYVMSTPADGGLVGALLSYGIPSGLVLGALLLVRFVQRLPPALWTLLPLLGLVGIVVLDITSRDTSVQAQVFLFFPVLFAASQLPRAAAILLTTLAVLSELAITFASEDARWALQESGFVCAALIAAAALLVHSASRQTRLIDQLAAQARVDPLTGLFTRRVLDASAAAVLAGTDERRAADKGEGTALMLIDLDLFKAVNDTYGHPVGDDFLVHVARFLTSRIRPGDLVARLGGDEFAVLLPDCSYHAALERAEHLLQHAAHAPLRLPDGTLLLPRFTVGIGHVPRGSGFAVRDLYSGADQALYRAKAAGRGRVA